MQFIHCLLKRTRGWKISGVWVSFRKPLRNLENSMAQSVVVNDFTRKGLFQHLVAHDGRALIANSETSCSTNLFWRSNQKVQDVGYSVVFMMELPNGRWQAPEMRRGRIATKRNFGEFFSRMHWPLVVLRSQNLFRNCSNLSRRQGMAFWTAYWCALSGHIWNMKKKLKPTATFRTSTGLAILQVSM